MRTQRQQQQSWAVRCALGVATQPAPASRGGRESLPLNKCLRRAGRREVMVDLQGFDYN